MTPTATLTIPGIANPAALLAASLDAQGAPVYALHNRPGVVVRDGQLVESLLDGAALAALMGGAPLRVWAGTERLLTLRKPTTAQDDDALGADPTAATWYGEDGPIAPFGALTLAKAFTADHKAWLRAPRR